MVVFDKLRRKNDIDLFLERIPTIQLLKELSKRVEVDSLVTSGLSNFLKVLRNVLRDESVLESEESIGYEKAEDKKIFKGQDKEGLGK